MTFAMEILAKSTKSTSFMKEIYVSWRILLLMLSEKSLSPYSKSVITTIFEGLLIWTNGCRNCNISARSRRCTANDGQSNKVFRILNSTTSWTQLVQCILKIVLKIVEIEISVSRAGKR